MSSPTISSPARSSPGHHALTPAQLTQLRLELERERRWLTGAAAYSWSGVLNDPDRARASESRTHQRLHQVLEALDRIASGTYGICSLCRSPIPFERLEVIPEAGTCLRCG